MKHSGFGIASCIVVAPVFFLGAVYGFLCWAIVENINTPPVPGQEGGRVAGTVFLTFMLVPTIALVQFTTAVGIGLAIAGIVIPQRKRLTAIAGFAMHAFFFVGSVIGYFVIARLVN